MSGYGDDNTVSLAGSDLYSQGLELTLLAGFSRLRGLWKLWGTLSAIVNLVAPINQTISRAATPALELQIVPPLAYGLQSFDRRANDR